MIRILLVDDHAIFRSGLKRLLSDEPDVRVMAEGKNAQEALDHLHRAEQGERFDLVLLDINLPGRSGLEALGHIRKTWPTQPVLMLSMYPEDQYAVKAIKAGAQGYVAKDADADELIRAIRIAANGGRYLSAHAMGEVLQQLGSVRAEAPHRHFSAREQQIFGLIVRGQSLTEIGEQMFLSVKTISTYRSRILKKLGLHSNAELVRYALEHRLVD